MTPSEDTVLRLPSLAVTAVLEEADEDAHDPLLALAHRWVARLLEGRNAELYALSRQVGNGQSGWPRFRVRQGKTHRLQLFLLLGLQRRPLLYRRAVPLA